MYNPRLNKFCCLKLCTNIWSLYMVGNHNRKFIMYDWQERERKFHFTQPTLGDHLVEIILLLQQ